MTQKIVKLALFMKKYLLLFLLLFEFTLYPISCKNIFWSLVSPVRSIDSQAEDKLKCWHDKKDNGEYFWSDDSYTNDERKLGFLRMYFPEDDPTSVDRLSKTLLLARNNRLIKEAVAFADPQGGPTLIETIDQDYEVTWQQQPKCDRFWWTIRYRRPYTYFATLGKWATEIAIVAGCIYAAKKLKKWYQNRTKSETLIFKMSEN